MVMRHSHAWPYPRGCPVGVEQLAGIPVVQTVAAVGVG